MIKIARFMVVQKVLEIAGPVNDEDEFNDDSPYDFNEDSGYDSGSGSISPLIAPAAARQQHRGCLQFVAIMMDKFMVRGSHSPM